MSAASSGDGPGPLNGLVIPADVDRPVHVADMPGAAMTWMYELLRVRAGSTVTGKMSKVFTTIYRT